MQVEGILAAKGRDCATVRANNSVSAAVALMAGRKIGAVVVTEAADRVVGIFTERDLVRLLAREGAGALQREVKDAMSRPVVSCRKSDRIEDAMAVMTARNIRHLPVMEGAELVGIVSIRDLVRRRLSEKEMEAAVLLDISRLHG